MPILLWCLGIIQMDHSFQIYKNAIQKLSSKITKGQNDPNIVPLEDGDIDAKMYCYCDGGCPDLCSMVPADKISSLSDASGDLAIVFSNYKKVEFKNIKAKALFIANYVKETKVYYESIKMLLAGPDYVIGNEFLEALDIFGLNDVTWIVTSTVNPDSFDESSAIYSIGNSPIVEADVDSDKFYLGLLGKVSGKDFKMPYSLKFHFKTVTIDMEAYDLNQPINDGSKNLLSSTSNSDWPYAPITIKDYHFDPRIKYTGTITNVDDFGDAFQKVLTTGAIIGIVVGCVAAVGIAVVIVVVVIKKKKKASKVAA